MKNILLALATFSFSAFAMADVDAAKAHSLLCEEAAKSYQSVFKDSKACLDETNMEIVEGAYAIAFESCGSSEWVTISLNPETGEILSGSEGYSCE